MAQSKTLLDGVNEVLKKVHIIQGDSGALTSLTDSGRQVYVDLAVQVWNEMIDDLYATSDMAYPQEIAQSTITLATSDRSYALAADVNQLRFPFKDETNRQYIHEYPGGYMRMISDQPAQLLIEGSVFQLWNTLLWYCINPWRVPSVSCPSLISKPLFAPSACHLTCLMLAWLSCVSALISAPDRNPRSSS